MTHTSRFTRARWSAVGAAVAVTLGAAGIGGYGLVSADVAADNQSAFVPITPCRLVDTRPAPNTVGPQTSPLGARETITVTAHGSNGECTGTSSIPTDAVGLSTNVTAAGPTANTFLTFWGEGPNPGTSNLNPRAGAAPTPNSVNTPLSSTGTFNIFNNNGQTNVIVDVNGYYAKIDSTSRFEELQINGDAFVGNDQADIDQKLDGRFSFTDDIGACAQAPVVPPVGGTWDTIDITHAITGSVEYSFGLAAYPTDPGISQLEAAIPLDVFAFGGLMLAPSFDLGETTLEPDYEFDLSGGYQYVLEVCTDDTMDVFDIRVSFSF